MFWHNWKLLKKSFSWPNITKLWVFKKDNFDAHFWKTWTIYVTLVQKMYLLYTYIVYRHKVMPITCRTYRYMYTSQNRFLGDIVKSKLTFWTQLHDHEFRFHTDETVF